MPGPHPLSITYVSSQESVIEIANPLPPTTPSNWAPSIPLPPSRAETPMDADRTPTRSPVASRSWAPSVSVESEDPSSPPRAVWCGSQEQTVREILARVRTDINTRVGPPTDAELDTLLVANGDDAVQFAESLANELTAKRIGYARYLQRLAIWPVPEGVFIADDDAVNAAFKVCAASLSAGFGRPGQGHLHHLSAKDWCRGFASVVSSCIRGLLVSPDVKHLISDALILPCDSFEVHDSLTFPESTLRLLIEMSSQLAHELASLCGYAGPQGEMPMFEWTSERTRLLEHLREDARLVVQDQTESWAERVNRDIEGRTLVEAAQQILTHLTSDPPDDVLRANEQRVRADIVHDIAQLAEIQFQAWAVDKRARQAAIPQERLDAEISSLHAARLNERIKAIARSEAASLLATRGQAIEDEILASHRSRAEQQGLVEAQRLLQDTVDNARKLLIDPTSATYTAMHAQAQREALAELKAQYKADALKADVDGFSARRAQAATAAKFDFVSFVMLEASKLGLHINPVAATKPVATPQPAKRVAPARRASPIDEVMKDANPPAPSAPQRPVMVRPLTTDPAVEATRGLSTSSHAPSSNGVASSMHAPASTASPLPPTAPPLSDTDKILAAIGLINKKVDDFGERLARVERGDTHRPPAAPIATHVAPVTPAPAPAPARTQKVAKPVPPARVDDAPPPSPSREAFPALPTAPPKPQDGFIDVRRRNLRPTFANVSHKAAHLDQTTRAKSAAVTAANGRGPSGRRKPGSVALPPSQDVTEVVVIREGGYADPEQERRLRKTSLGFIVADIKAALASQSADPPKLLRGRWSQSVEKTGNFVLTFTGLLDFNFINSYAYWILDPFGHGYLTLADGWRWIHLKGVQVTDRDGSLFDSEQLLAELQDNPVFDGVCFQGLPYWLQGVTRLQHFETGTVIVGIQDRDGTRVDAISRAGVAMFGHRVRVSPVPGDRPIITQCGRCWQMGHCTNDPKCKIPRSAVLCLRCGKRHRLADHDHECPATTHKIGGKCDCDLPCLLCKKRGHNARSRKCGMRGDHTAPREATIVDMATPPAPARTRKTKAPSPIASPTSSSFPSPTWSSSRESSCRGPCARRRPDAD